jgi:hypothetical protein
MRPLSKQSATEDTTKNIPTFIITKTKQVTIFIKNQNCFIYRLILAIVCMMVEVHQSSIPHHWVEVTPKTQQNSEVGELTKNITDKQLSSYFSSIAQNLQPQQEVFALIIC